MSKEFDEWWYNGGSKKWAETVDTDILRAIKMAFESGVEAANKTHERECTYDDGIDFQ